MSHDRRQTSLSLPQAEPAPRVTLTTHGENLDPPDSPELSGRRDFLKSFLVAPAFWWQSPLRQVTYSLGRLAGTWDEQIFPSDDLALRRALFSGARILVVGHVALAARNEAEEMCPTFDTGLLCPSAASDAIARDRGMSIAADVAFGLGVAAAGVGLYFVITDLAQPSQSRASVVVAVEPSRLAMSGRF